MRRFVVVTLLAFLCGSSAARSQQSNGAGPPPGKWLSLQGYTLADDPGPQPSNDGAEYQPYRVDDGTAVDITEDTEVRDAIPAAYKEVLVVGDAFAIPDTPYVRWAIATYARHIDHTSLEQAGVTFDDGFFGYKPLHLPSYLLPWRRKSLVREGEASAEGRVVIGGLAAKPYILLMNFTVRGPLIRPPDRQTISEEEVPWSPGLPKVTDSMGLIEVEGSEPQPPRYHYGQSWLVEVYAHDPMLPKTRMVITSNAGAAIATFVISRSDYTW